MLLSSPVLVLVKPQARCLCLRRLSAPYYVLLMFLLSRPLSQPILVDYHFGGFLIVRSFGSTRSLATIHNVADVRTA